MGIRIESVGVGNSATCRAAAHSIGTNRAWRGVAGSGGGAGGGRLGVAKYPSLKHAVCLCSLDWSEIILTGKSNGLRAGRGSSGENQHRAFEYFSQASTAIFINCTHSG